MAVVLLAGIFTLLVRFVPSLAMTSARAEVTPITMSGRLGLAGVVVCGGLVIAAVYAFMFEFVVRRAGWLVGAVIGLGHAAVVWLGAGIAARLFPDIADTLAGDLSLLFDSVLAIAAFVLLHVVYGAIVGAMYGTPKHSASDSTRVAWREYSPARKTRID